MAIKSQNEEVLLRGEHPCTLKNSEWVRLMMLKFPRWVNTKGELYLTSRQKMLAEKLNQNV